MNVKQQKNENRFGVNSFGVYATIKTVAPAAEIRIVDLLQRGSKSSQARRPLDVKVICGVKTYLYNYLVDLYHSDQTFETFIDKYTFSRYNTKDDLKTEFLSYSWIETIISSSLKDIIENPKKYY
jgi:hypothetical protein